MFSQHVLFLFYFFVLQETVRTTEKKKNYTSWSSPSSSKNASWIFSRAKNRDESRKRTVKSDWLFDRAHSRKKFHDLTNAEWYNRKVYSKHCDQDGNCKTIDYVSNSTSGSGWNYFYFVNSNTLINNWDFFCENIFLESAISS